MTERKIILASSSPRRRELMEMAGFDFEIKSVDVEEKYPEGLDKRQIPEYLAALKANASRELLDESNIILAADTIVLLGDEVLGKPVDETEAAEMIRKLSAKSHDVITGVCLLSLNKQECFSETTTVYFKELTEDEIRYYVSEYKPYDKAGAYAIQEWIGLIGIERIEGDYFNVVGLPVQSVYKRLIKFQI